MLGDQVTGDHEEDVHADEAAVQQGREGVEAQHRQDRDGAQPVYIGAVIAFAGYSLRAYRALDDLVGLHNLIRGLKRH